MSYDPPPVPPPYLASQGSNASSILEEYPVEPAIFVDQLKAVQAKVQNSDLTHGAKVLLGSTLHHLGICEGAWRMMSFMEDTTEAKLEQLAGHIRTVVLIPSRFQ